MFFIIKISVQWIAIDDSNEKIIQETKCSKNTTNLSEHVIFIPSTYPFMGNGQLLFFKW
jgi:hypothetical protein